jgi:catechol 2,3-dioxygenase-like lactoylglutathione lyase family enzyme
MNLDLVAIVVRDYDEAIDFFTSALGFELVEDSPSLTNDGRPKRWVVVEPQGARRASCSRRPTSPETSGIC